MIISHLVHSIFCEIRGKLAGRGNMPRLWPETSNARRLKFNYSLGL